MRFRNLAVLVTIFWSLIILGCGGGGNSKIGTTNFVGTQTPGDYWSWTRTTDASGGVTFTAINNTQGLNYSGSEIQLTGGSAGFSKLNITSSNDPKVPTLTTPASAYTLEIPDTMVMAAMSPFYTFDHDGIVQLSVKGPVVAAAQGTCPSEGTTNVNWIIMPGSDWCPTATAVIATKSCSSADNAYGTAVITVSGGTYTVDVTPYHLDGSAGDPVLLSSCTCSEGVIQCSDSNTNPVRIAFTPSGIFIQDSASYGFAGVVQPASDIDLSKFPG